MHSGTCHGGHKQEEFLKLEDMVVPDVLHKTASDKDFFIVEGQVTDAVPSQVIGLGRCTVTTTLNDAEEWYGDGTFNVVKNTLFEQVFIIVCKSMT